MELSIVGRDRLTVDSNAGMIWSRFAKWIICRRHASEPFPGKGPDACRRRVGTLRWETHLSRLNLNMPNREVKRQVNHWYMGTRG